jgi:hypothetical protein
MPVDFPYQGATSVAPPMKFRYQGTTSVVPPKWLRPQGFSPCKFRETILLSTMQEEETK